MRLAVYKRPWSWGRVWLTRYTSRRLFAIQVWIGYRAYVLLLSRERYS
jgi:hypothetical protein